MYKIPLNTIMILPSSVYKTKITYLYVYFIHYIYLNNHIIYHFEDHLVHVIKLASDKLPKNSRWSLADLFSIPE